MCDTVLWSFSLEFDGIILECDDVTLAYDSRVFWFDP